MLLFFIIINRIPSHFKNLCMICVKKLVVISRRFMGMRHQGLQQWILLVAVILTCFQLQDGNFRYVYSSIVISVILYVHVYLSTIWSVRLPVINYLVTFCVYSWWLWVTTELYCFTWFSLFSWQFNTNLTLLGFGLVAQNLVANSHY